MSVRAALFNRAYQLSIGPKNSAGSSIAYGNTQASKSALRIAFDIAKSSVGTPNTAKVTIYNMAKDNRNVLGKDYLLELRAGYNNLVETLFVGNVTKAVSERNGADIVTVLDVADGEAAISFAFVNKSYGGPVTLVQILKDVARAMSLATPLSPDGISAGIVHGIPDVTYARGYTAHGPCRDVLTALLKPQGLEWSVQNAALNIIPIDASSTVEAEIISAKTGMIGLPTLNDETIQFTSLLNPKLAPGTLVSIESDIADINRICRIRDCKIEGDTHDTKWNLTAQCVPVEGATKVLKVTSSFEYEAN